MERGGRKRRRRAPPSTLGEQALQARLVENGYAQFSGPIEFGAGLLAGEHVVGVLADRRGEGAACGLDPLDVVAARPAQGTGYDELLANERTLHGPHHLPLEV